MTYDHKAFVQNKRNALAALDNGEPAWPLAEENGIAFATFETRLRRGWSGQRAATEGARKETAAPKDEFEALAVENGVSLRAYRTRVRNGTPPFLAAIRGVR